jgi:hypothetical protein
MMNLYQAKYFIWAGTNSWIEAGSFVQVIKFDNFWTVIVLNTLQILTVNDLLFLEKV